MGMVKLAAPWGLLASAGKTLLKSNAVRNATIGAGVGAIGGAINSDDGKRMSGALKGGLVGGLVGGAGTFGANSFNRAASKNITLGKAIGQEADILGRRFRTSYNIASGKATSFKPTVPIAKPAASTAMPVAPIAQPSLSSKVTPSLSTKVTPMKTLPWNSAAHSEDALLSAEQMKSSSMLSVPTVVRNKGNLTYADAQKYGVNIEDLTSQNQNVAQMRHLANNALPVTRNSPNLTGTPTSIRPKKRRGLISSITNAIGF